MIKMNIDDRGLLLRHNNFKSSCIKGATPPNLRVHAKSDALTSWVLDLSELSVYNFRFKILKLKIYNAIKIKTGTTTNTGVSVILITTLDNNSEKDIILK